MKYYYLILMLGSVLFPVLFSFDKKVHFASYLKSLSKSIPLVALLFIAGDLLYTYLEVWGFNHQFITGIYFFNLPLEEVLFFLFVPYACLFLYKVLQAYLPNIHAHIPTLVLYVLSILLLVASIIFRTKLYTTLSLMGAALILIYLARNPSKQNMYMLMAYAVSLVPFILINGALTGLFTDLPVVWYNDAENLGVRITTIPIEDFFYSFNLLMLNMFVFNYYENKRKLD